MVTETICLQCGSRGFENAFVYCIRCLKFAVHRYCLDEIPETLDEFVCWLCDDCEVIVQKKTTVFEHGAIQCQARVHKVSKCIASFSRNGMEESGLVIVENELVCKDASDQARDGCAEIDSVECGELAIQHSPVELDGKNDENPISAISQQSQQLEEEKVKGNLIGSIELSAGCPTGSTTEKDQLRLAIKSCDECVEVGIGECTKTTCDSTIPSLVKENGCSEQKEDEEKKIKNKKRDWIRRGKNGRFESKRRGKIIAESNTEKAQLGLATSYDECVKVDNKECTRSASDSTLLSKVKENDRSEQKDQEEKKIENENKKEMKSEENTTESNTEKIQYRLATSYDECVKIDNKECTRSASDSTLLSKVEENDRSEQKDQEEKKIENEKEMKREKNTIESNTGKVQDRLATSDNECVKVDNKECTRSVSDSTLLSKVKENRCSDQKDQEEKKIGNKKRQRKRKRNIMGIGTEKDQHRASLDEHVKADISDCTRLGSDSALPSKVKENRCSEQKAREKKKIKNRKARERKRKRTQNIMGCTTEKDQLRLATTSHDEHVKADINGRTRLGSDSALPSNVKESEGCEQKDQKCITKPFDSAADLGVTGAHAADHPIISSDGPSKSLSNERTITCTETISQKQVHQPGVSDISIREKDLDSSGDRVENRGPEDREEQQTSTSYQKDLDYSVAQPIATPVWRGSFSIPDSKYGSIDELIAHISNKACHKVYEAASQFQPVLHLELLPKYDIWPKSFQTSEPNGDNIALYFFPSKICNQVFEQLVEEMIHNELALKGVMQNSELLFFTSTELPLRFWRFQNRYYLWGVFRGKQAAPSNPPSRVGEVAEFPR